ncbi:hypothetical protein [Bosea rubneri]|uniref:Uncharacterized protein n=1 Tax=Bosea rubneri TaxID=3075434 RepID=A0ABU3SGP5_9HYPH|nr:hypothetical protein [Bosea sp. ZW T0_25]MDU0343894.1 hypothetical protein [Bosea sp. ZW T0_25]
MRAQPKRAGHSSKLASVPVPIPLELYREACQDEDGNRYTVIVSALFPNLSTTSYALEDGTPVRFVDDCLFEIVPTGRTLTRCE